MHKIFLFTLFFSLSCSFVTYYTVPKCFECYTFLVIYTISFYIWAFLQQLFDSFREVEIQEKDFTFSRR